MDFIYLYLYLSIYLYIYTHTHTYIYSCGMWTLSCSMWNLVPWPVIKAGPPALGALSLNHWTTTEIPVTVLTRRLVEVMEFQLSYFKSWKMVLRKCSTQYANKLGKLSSGHRTGKGQLSFQSQRKAMSENAQTTAQLHSSHTLVK